MVLTHKLWSHLGGDPKLVGKSMRINGEPYTVIGVLAPGLADRGNAQVTVPHVFKPEQLNHDFHWLLSIGRLKPGVTIKQAQADMDSVATHIAETYPKSNKGWGVFVEPLKNDFHDSREAAFNDPWSKALRLLFISVDPEIVLAEPRSMDEVRDLVLSNDRFTFILFVSFAVVALLLAALGVYGVMSFSVAQRSNKIALRMALGANRGRVVALIVREGLALACIGLAFGLVGAYFVGRGMQSTLFEVGKIDLSVFVSVALLLVAAAIIACLIPAHRAA